MFWFWLALGALTCAATASLVLPLLARGRSRGSQPSPSDEARRVAVYRDRRAEIEAEREAGRLTEEEARRAIDELVEDAARQLPGQPPPAQAPVASGGRGTALAVAAIASLLIPFTALIVYATLGTPTVVGADTATMRQEISPQMLEKATAELRERVQKAPQDAEGWTMLAEAEMLAGNGKRAAEAYGRAVALTPGQPRLLADYAEAQMLAQGGDFSGKPVELLEQALAIDPNEDKAVALMGAAQYRIGNRARALSYMKQLAAKMQPGSHEAQRLGEVIAKIESEIAGGAPAGAPVPAPSSAARPGAAATAPSASMSAPPAAASPQTAPAGDASTIVGTITIDDALRAQAAPGTTMFLVARGTDGSRVPLAALRLAVGDWPLAFRIGDAQAMDPSRSISAAKGVILEARISRTGTPMRQSGDLFGVTPELRPGTRDVVVRIDQRVP